MPRLSDSRWAQLLDAFHNSDLSHSEFARRHGLSIHTFRARLYDKRRSTPEPEASPFLQLQVVDAAAPLAATSPTPPASALVVERGGTRLDFTTLPESAWLADLLARLGRAVS